MHPVVSILGNIISLNKTHSYIVEDNHTNYAIKGPTVTYVMCRYSRYHQNSLAVCVSSRCDILNVVFFDSSFLTKQPFNSSGCISSTIVYNVKSQRVCNISKSLKSVTCVSINIITTSSPWDLARDDS